VHQVSPVLRASLLCVAAVAAVLGLFAVGGDWLGLWKPLQPEPTRASSLPARHHRAAPKSRPHNKARSSSARTARRSKAAPKVTTHPAPPVPARQAFLLAAIAASLAVLTSLLQRMPMRDLLRTGDRFGQHALQSLRATGGGHSTNVRLPSLRRGLNTSVIPSIARRAALVRANVLGVVRREQRRPSRRTRRVTGYAAHAASRSTSRLLDSVTLTVVRSYASARSVASATFSAAPYWRWKLRGAWARGHEDIAVYLAATALAILVGWFVSSHILSG